MSEADVIAARARAAEGLPASNDGPVDQRERDRIRDELDRNLLVEAGAGSGKTRALVERMLGLVRAGVSVDRIAAVTFTRKAAGELAQRFRGGLEEAYAESVSAGTPTAPRFDHAMREVDRAFVGTIHAFCARILREHPLEAGVDPGFVELGEADLRRLVEDYWVWHLDRRHAVADPVLERLREVGIEPADLKHAFLDGLDDTDVVFTADSAPPPDFEAAREPLLALMNRARELLAGKPPGTPADPLQASLRRLRWSHESTGWTAAKDFCAALQGLSKTACDVKQYLWAEDKVVKKEAGALGKAFVSYVESVAQPLLESWYAHRYPAVLGFLEPLLREFQEHRRRRGLLTFQDLLQLSAHLLRDDPDVRRHVGERYRYLLVDEFQDTDPLQAEVCFLIASEPHQGDDWREVVPRPGALFVVGDPKQSIYRFRRADIAIYDLVRRRIQAFGEVVVLTANFRSKAVIGRFVDAAFEPLFDRGAGTAEQAPFAPMNTIPRNALGGGLFRYEIPSLPGGDNQELLAARDAAAVATWIRGRTDRGERKPQDFLILPYRKFAVASYARELEKRGIAVTTAGAGLSVERELRELIVLLEALADPQEQVWTVAALEGLFFGLELQQLWEHRLAGGSFSFERVEFDLTSPVDGALATLARWAKLCRRLPVDSALVAIVEETGLLPLGAAGEMAESGAGSLVHAFDLIAAGAIRGAADLRSAIEAIEAARDLPEIEAPLRPGRSDAVRVMNLHKAKGLEAPVVILPHPTGSDEDRPIFKHVRRTRRAPEVFLRVTEAADRGQRTLAQPARWPEYERAERGFRNAEFRRLLYVAATRAKEELVVAECVATHVKSPWRELHDELQRQATLLEILPTDPAPPVPIMTSAEGITARIEAVHARRSAAAKPAFAVETVTGAAKEELEFHGSEGRGREWGTLVHQAIARMGRGGGGESLWRYVRALLLAAERPTGGTGEPAELDELMDLLERVRASPAWTALAAAAETRWELAVASLQDPPGGPPTLVTGTMDAVGLRAAGEPWSVVDWKTDTAEGDEWTQRERHYRQQVQAYGEILRHVAGARAEGVIERVR